LTLKRALVVVSLFTVGQDSEIDDELDSLREDLRNGVLPNSPISERFKNRIEKLESLFKDYERQNALGTEQLISYVQKQAGQLLEQTSSDDLEMTLRTLRRDAGIELQTWKGCRQQVLRWVDLYEQVFEEASQQASAQPISSTTTDTTRPTEPDRAVETAQESESEVVDSSIAAALDELDSEEIYIEMEDADVYVEEEVPVIGLDEAKALIISVTKSLAELVKRLALGENLDQAREELQSRIENANQDADWPQLLDETTNMVLSSLKTNSLAIAQFLRSLEQHVGAVQTHMEEADFASNDLRTRLAAGIGDDIKNARERLHTWYDPVVAAEEVEGYLGRIEARLAKYDELQTEREKELEKQLQNMQRRLEQITDESLQAQKDLDDHLRSRMRKATLDSLTGLPNRAAYLMEAKEAWAEMSSNPSDELSLMVADVDEFSRIREQLGHQAGDRVLKIIAAALRKTLPKKEFLGRLEGDAFVAIINADAQGASVIAEILRSSIEGIPCHFQGKPVPISMSFGVASIRKGEPANLTHNRAEAALRQAKEEGRNRVVKAPA
ncbi:MAG: GGDEF domain-containing protein, partial [Oceanobacter sp.]